MHVSAWAAAPRDLDVLVRLYRSMEAEQVALKPVWRLADALPEPAEESLGAAVADPATVVCLGGIDGIPFGFVVAGVEGLLPQANGVEVGVVRFIYTEEEARAVGIGEAMITAALAELRRRGLHLFDVRVLPGHRNAKNFFEANGFAARSITMHHADLP